MQERHLQYNRNMEIFIVYSSLFYLGSLGGWVIELFFRRYISQKRWVNPGFLVGPIVPLYGFGLTSFYFFSNVIPWQNISSISWLNTLIEVFAAGLFMTVIEYIAGIIFIKGMHIKLWDYSKRPLNVQGIICPLFSFIWLICGALYVYLCNPLFVRFAEFISANWFYLTFPIGVFYGVTAVDFGYSMQLVAKIRKAIANSKAIASWEKLKVSFKDYLKERKERSNFLFAFSSKKEEFDAMVREAMAKSKRDYDDYIAKKLAKKEAKKLAKRNEL